MIQSVLLDGGLDIIQAEARKPITMTVLFQCFSFPKNFPKNTLIFPKTYFIFGNFPKFDFWDNSISLFLLDFTRVFEMLEFFPKTSSRKHYVI